MSSTLQDIQPETLTLIESQANSLRMSVDEYLRRFLLPADQRELALRPVSDNDEFEADMAALAQDTADLAVYDGTYSREDIYVDHD